MANESIKARLAAAKAASVTLTDEEKDVAADLAEAERLEAETRAALSFRRQRDLDERVEKAQAKALPGVTCRGVDLEEKTPGAGTYVVKTPDMRDWRDFMDRLTKGGKDADHTKINIDLSVDCCVDPWCQDEDTADKVRATLKLYPGAGLTLGNVCTELAGLATDAAKSSR